MTEKKSHVDLYYKFILKARALSKSALRNRCFSKKLLSPLNPRLTSRVAAVIIKILFRGKKKGGKWSDKRNEPIVDVKAFPFNYNRSQPGSPSASASGGAGSGERFYRRSATVVRTSALKPPLKFAELFICPASMFVPTSYRSFFSEKLKISESFSSCPLPSFAPSFPFVATDFSFASFG